MSLSCLSLCFLLVFRAKADWIRDHKRKGATSVVFFCLCLFVICFAFLLEFACAFVCFFYFCVVVNITDIQDTKLVTNHDLVCMARVSCVHVRLATVTNPCPLWAPVWPLLACECICCIFLVESWVCL